MLADELTLDVQVPRVKIESHHDSLIVVAKKVYGMWNEAKQIAISEMEDELQTSKPK